jgi:hypothetical protein
MYINEKRIFYAILDPTSLQTLGIAWNEGQWYVSIVIPRYRDMIAQYASSTRLRLGEKTNKPRYLPNLWQQVPLYALPTTSRNCRILRHRPILLVLKYVKTRAVISRDVIQSMHTTIMFILSINLKLITLYLCSYCCIFNSNI